MSVTSPSNLVRDPSQREGRPPSPDGVDYVIDVKMFARRTVAAGFVANRFTLSVTRPSTSVGEKSSDCSVRTGSGKTTLVKILLGITRRTSGQATILGYPAGDIAAAAARRLCARKSAHSQSP